MILSQAEIDTIKAHRAAALLDSKPFWDLAYAVCQQYGVKAADLSRSTRGNATTCLARNMVCYLAHKRGWTQTAIAKLLRRDSTSVCHAIAKTRAKLESETPAN